MGTSSLVRELIKDEGYKRKPYRCTAGKLTIGIGRNLDDVGLTAEETIYLFGQPLTKEEYISEFTKHGLSLKNAWFLCENDIDRSLRDLRLIFKNFDSFTDNRQRALANMMFNLGLSRFMGFRKMIDAIQIGHWARAAREAIDSKWAKQVGARATRIYDLIKKG